MLVWMFSSEPNSSAHVELEMNLFSSGHPEIPSSHKEGNSTEFPMPNLVSYGRSLSSTETGLAKTILFIFSSLPNNLALPTTFPLSHCGIY